MAKAEFVALDLQDVTIQTFDCGKHAINTYLRRYAAKNMALNLNRTFVLPVPQQTGKSHVAAFYTLALQTIVRADLPDPAQLPRYPLPVILLAQLGVDQHYQGRGLGAKTLVTALRHAWRLASAADGIAAMGVVLDVLDQDAARFYQHFDFFLPLSEQPDRLFCPIRSLELL